MTWKDQKGASLYFFLKTGNLILFFQIMMCLRLKISSRQELKLDGLQIMPASFRVESHGSAVCSAFLLLSGHRLVFQKGYRGKAVATTDQSDSYT